MAQITIKWVNPAKPDKKFGSIVDVDGTKYMCPAALVSQFKPGTTVDVPTQSAKWGADVVEVIQGHAQATATSTSAWSKPQAPAVSPPASPPAAFSTPATGAMDRKDALIFVTGTVGRAMGSGKFAAGDLMDLTHESLKAWFMLKDQLK